MNICTFQAHDAPVIGYLHDDHDRLVAHKTRPALVICAGGCYRWLSPREKDPVALHWAALGYQTFLIEYSTEARASGLRPLREKQPDGSRHPFDQFIVAKTPAARWGEAEDLMGPAVFLASDASNFVNGHILYVDGGILAYIGKQP